MKTRYAVTSSVRRALTRLGCPRSVSWSVLACVVGFAGALLPGVARTEPPQVPNQVLSVSPDGPAEKGGLQPGDRILRAAGQAAEGWTTAEWRAFLAARESTVPLELQVRRGDQLHTLQVVPQSRLQLDQPWQPIGFPGPRPAPVWSADAGGAQLRFSGPYWLFTTAAEPGPGAQLQVRADTISRIVRAVFPGERQQIVFRCEGNVTCDVGASVRLEAPSPTWVQWTEWEGVVGIQPGWMPELRLLQASRCRGWGLSLWDPEDDFYKRRRVAWRRELVWGFTLAGVGHSALTAGPPEHSDGARVRAVARGTPADRAGLAAGDLILTAGDHRINHPYELYRKMAASFPTQRIPLTYRRGLDPAVRRTTLIVEVDSIPDAVVVPPVVRRHPEPTVVQQGDRRSLSGLLGAQVRLGDQRPCTGLSVRGSKGLEEKSAAQGARSATRRYAFTGQVTGTLETSGGLLRFNAEHCEVRWVQDREFLHLILPARAPRFRASDLE